MKLFKNKSNQKEYAEYNETPMVSQGTAQGFTEPMTEDENEPYSSKKPKDKGTKGIIIAIIILGILLLGLLGFYLFQHFADRPNTGFSGGGGGGSSAAEEPADTQKDPGDEKEAEETTPAANAEEGSSSLSGRVFDASSKEAIKDAQVSAISGGNSEIGSTNGSGIYDFELEDGLYRVTITSAGHEPCVINNVKVREGQQTVLDNLFLLPEGKGGLENQSGGTVLNMISGSAEADVSVRFRENWNSTTGDYVTGNGGQDIVLKTDAEGKFRTKELPCGYYTAELSKEGFATQYINVISSSDEALSTGQTMLLPPKAEGDDYRITLSWGSEPKDLDAHLTGTVPEPFEVYYGNRSAVFNGQTVATLDRNDQNGNGFETVTLKVDPAGTYRYYVAKYKSSSGSFVNSNAIVKVYKGGELVEQFNAPVSQEDGRYWNVFNIAQGKIVPVNKVADTTQQ